jgi:ketosteroid isomerase-like protein
MSDAIQQLIDKEAICSVIYRLARAVDRRDLAQLQSCYHHDALEDHGAYVGSAAKFCELASTPPGIYERMHHNVGTIHIELDGDMARSEAYVCASGRLIAPGADGSVQSRSIYARYIDRFERRDGEWRIAQRIVVKDWTDVRAITDPDEDYPLSRNGPEDISYTHVSPRLSAMDAPAAR